MNYYNDVDPYVCAWLENLILADLIPNGDVDGRSILDVTAGDVRGYTQAHFFCGIAGWPLALQLAGWPEDRPIWTGSAPCQPFSQAGQGKGLADERHLWPHFYGLIRECRPPVVVGEQVASKDAEPWLDHVLADLEAVDYSGGAVAFPSASIGAPHIRDRTYWLGHTNNARLEGLGRGHSAAEGQRQTAVRSTAAASGAVRMADAGRGGNERACGPGEARGALETNGGETQQRERSGATDRTSGASRGVADTHGVRQQPSAGARIQADAEHDTQPCSGDECERPSPTNGQWRAADWLLGRDAKWRPVEPGTFPLADGVPARMERVRAYGNAINAEQGAEFMRAVMECLP